MTKTGFLTFDFFTLFFLKRNFFKFIYFRSIVYVIPILGCLPTVNVEE
jgi:hypothetical protein